jgi:CheY-like chemotaxis protein
VQVLIVDGNRNDRELASRYLASAGHEVVAVSDARGATSAAERQTPDVVVLDWQVAGGPAFLDTLRRRGDAVHPYVIAVSSKPSANDLAAAIAGGADDFMRKPLSKDELVIRAGALERIRGWAATLFGGAPPSEPGVTDFVRLQAWREVDQSIARDIGGVLGQTLVPTPGPETPPSSVVAAQIPLMIAAEGTEVRLTVSVDTALLGRLGELCLGDPAAPEDTLRDILRELANTSGGGFVRTAGEEGVALTCGLPVDVVAEPDAKRRVTAKRRFVVAVEDGSLQIAFEIEVLPRATRRVNVAQLSEGMVLARDLHNGAGALLVPAGTRLTQSQIERMRRVLATHVTFDVAEAA